MTRDSTGRREVRVRRSDGQAEALSTRSGRHAPSRQQKPQSVSRERDWGRSQSHWACGTGKRAVRRPTCSAQMSLPAWEGSMKRTGRNADPKNGRLDRGQRGNYGHREAMAETRQESVPCQWREWSKMCFCERVNCLPEHHQRHHHSAPCRALEIVSLWHQRRSFKK